MLLQVFSWKHEDKILRWWTDTCVLRMMTVWLSGKALALIRK